MWELLSFELICKQLLEKIKMVGLPQSFKKDQ